MTIPHTGVASIRLRPGMSDSARKSVGDVFIREFGQLAGPRLMIAGFSLDDARTIADAVWLNATTTDDET